MKNILFLIGLLLIFSCKKKPQNSISKKDSAITAIDSAAVNIDSSTIENSKQNEVQYEEPKDGDYSKIIKGKNISVELFYTIKDGMTDYSRLKIFNGNKTQNLKIVSDWGFRNIDQIDVLFEDVNFDGADDITITKEIGMNWSTDVLLINNNGTFVRNKKYEEIMNPSIYVQEKLIISEYRVSGVGDISKTYQWKGNELLIIDSSENVYGLDKK